MGLREKVDIGVPEGFEWVEEADNFGKYLDKITKIKKVLKISTIFYVALVMLAPVAGLLRYVSVVSIFLYLFATALFGLLIFICWWRSIKICEKVLEVGKHLNLELHYYWM